VPLTWQGFVCVQELLNFCSDSTKKLFKKQEAAIKEELKGFISADLKELPWGYIRFWVACNNILAC
jgi:hypothetical protein